jgi:N-acetylglucosamine kinase-like BadF-type ATPase
MQEAVLGIDGGGTKTVALLADMTGRPLARAEGGPANIQRMAVDEVRAVLQPLLLNLFTLAPAPIRVDALWAGFAGAGSIPSHEPIRLLLLELLSGLAGERLILADNIPIAIDHDMVIALTAGAGSRRGIVVISGTGSSVYGEDGLRRVRVGGWGPYFGDEGSGYAIGQQALRSVLQSYDGRLPVTMLTDALCRHLDCSSPPELLYHWHGRAPAVAEVAELARLVAEIAAQGDDLAREILATAGRELGRAVTRAVEALGLAHAAFPLILSGGILRHVAPVREELMRSVYAAAPAVEPELLTAEPVTGAIQLAWHLATERSP